MFEFNGCLSESTKKYADKQSSGMIPMLVLLAFAAVTPLVYVFANALKSTIGVGSVRIVQAFQGIFAMVCLFILIFPQGMPSSKKVARRVYIDGEVVVSDLGNGKEMQKTVSEVKFVTDYGNFYELVFANDMKTKGKFICQKDLIVKGTLEEFEAFFENKIVRI